MSIRMKHAVTLLLLTTTFPSEWKKGSIIAIIKNVTNKILKINV